MQNGAARTWPSALLHTIDRNRYAELANAVSTTEIMFADFYKKGKLSQRTGQILLSMMRHRFFDPKDIAAKRLCTCSGDSSGRLQKPQCTLTTYGRKGMEIRRWSLLCSITWSCSGKKCGIQNGSTSSTLQFGPFSGKKCGIQNGSTISTIHFGPFSMQQAIV